MKREPAGIPVGGQWATDRRDEAEVDLGRDWGSLSLGEGSRTPWGEAQQVSDIAPGIAVVSTAGHGGIKLSPERNREIHPSLRNRSGWYEEDCEHHIVSMHFAPELAAEHATFSPDSDYADPDKRRALAVAGVKEWFPDAYEKATGEKVSADESRVVAEREFLDANAGKLITTSAIRSTEHPGMVEVTASIGRTHARGESRTFLVPQGEYTSSRLGFVVDPDKYTDITPELPAQVPTVRYTEIDDSKLSATGKQRLAKDLGTRYRSRDGQVRTLANVIAEGKISGKDVDVEGTRRTYSLKAQEFDGDGSYTSYPVSKATYDAFVAPGLTEERKARLDLRVAEAKFEKVSEETARMRNFREADELRRAARNARDAARVRFESVKSLDES